MNKWLIKKPANIDLRQVTLYMYNAELNQLETMDSCFI